VILRAGVDSGNIGFLGDESLRDANVDNGNIVSEDLRQRLMLAVSTLSGRHIQIEGRFAMNPYFL
jgi:hypothetical protein